MRRFKAEPDAVKEAFEELEEAGGQKGAEAVSYNDPAGVSGREEESSAEIFPEEYLEPFRGLLFLGDMSKEVWYGGHCFVMRTLREGEILRIGQLIRDYRETLTEIEARKLYTVAAAVESVDGMPLSIAYKKGYDVIPDKAEEVKQWYPAVVGYLHKQYIDMEMTAIEVANAIKK